MRQYQRKYHKKSKAGCSQCKSKRIKCDERHPTCFSCERRGVRCDFETIGSPQGQNVTQCENSSPQSIPESSEEFDRSRPSLESQPRSSLSISTTSTIPCNVSPLDLELMYHWTTVTAVDMGDSGTGRPHLEIWQKHVPELAFKHTYLMCGLLSLSALHLGYLSPQRRTELNFRASALQQAALAEFQIALNGLSESTCHALFSFSLLLIPITCANLSIETESGGSVPDTFTWAWLGHGSFNILQRYRQHLCNSFLEPLLAYESMSAPAEKADSSDTRELSKLFSLTANLHDEQESEACVASIHSLMNTFSQHTELMRRRDEIVLVLFFWAAQRSQKFMELLSRNNPEVLVVLGHFCVLVERSARGVWFMKHCAQNILDFIRESVPEGYETFLEWPQRAILEAQG